MGKVSAGDILSRAQEHYNKADRALEEAATYRAEATRYLDQVAATCSNQALTDVWSNANHYEAEYLRTARVERRRGDRLMRRYSRKYRDEGELERAILHEDFGKNFQQEVLFHDVDLDANRVEVFNHK